MEKHWSERLKDSLLDTARFMSEYGKEFGMASFATLGVAAVTAGCMAAGTDNSMVSQELESMALGLGMSGILAGGYTTAASVICDKLVQKADLNEVNARHRLKDRLAEMTGQVPDNPEAAVMKIASDPHKDKIMREILGSSKDSEVYSMYRDMAEKANERQAPEQWNAPEADDTHLEDRAMAPACYA